MTDARQSAYRVSVVVHASDNVATVLDHHEDKCLLDGNLPIDPGVPFGHKIALAPIAQGAAVIKYGVVIGHATQPIQQGEHVHVHNVR